MTPPENSTPTFPARLSIRQEDEIVAGWKPCAQVPLVSICCATYNHRRWIEDAICGFLAQETNFPFEIIIRDDASDDGTTEIILTYAEKYPRIIRPVINETNRFKLGERPGHVWSQLANGQYIAFCEGDDFWISPTKLQKQVDLLEAHKDAVMSVGLTHMYQQEENGSKYLRTTQPGKSQLIYFDEVHTHYFHTSTYLIRRDVFVRVIADYFAGHTLFGDTALRAILVSLGPFALLPEVVSVYRITGNGIWSSLDTDAKLKWEFKAAQKLSGMLPGQHGRLQRDKLYGIAKSLCRMNLRVVNPAQAIRWGGLALWYGVRKAPSYAIKKIKTT